MLNLSKLRMGLWGRSALKTIGLACLFGLLAPGLPARADVPLRRADIEAILNRVEFIPRGRSARTARVSDFLSIGDVLRTAAQSRAELRFNDGSLARVGERATFRFIPNTRNFRLSDGTMLLLIPPGRGRSTIQTPSAITGIQGSALVVRHVESRDLTLVMALTNNPAGAMTVTMANCSGPECTSEYNLKAGQMVLIQDNQIELLDFDLQQFYETSPILEGLELDNPNSTLDLGPALNQVREETLDALENYVPMDAEQSFILNPEMVSVTSTAEDLAGQPWLLTPTPDTSVVIGERPSTALPAGLLVETETDSSGTVSSPEPTPLPVPDISITPDVPDSPGVPTSSDGETENPDNPPANPGGGIDNPGNPPANPGGGIDNPGNPPANPGGGIDNPGDPPANPGGGIDNPGNPPANPGGGIDNPGDPPANPGGGIDNPGNPPANPGGGIDNPGNPPANPGGGIDNPGNPPANPGGGIDNPGNPPANPGGGIDNPGNPPANPGGGIDNPGNPPANPGGGIDNPGNPPANPGGGIDNPGNPPANPGGGIDNPGNPPANPGG